MVPGDVTGREEKREIKKDKERNPLEYMFGLKLTVHIRILKV